MKLIGQSLGSRRLWLAVIAIGVGVGVGMTMVGCQQAAQAPAESESNSHLRAALMALDRGDESLAEQELNDALAADPLNNRARTTLASLYASRAGISLPAWLDPFWDAGRKLNSSLRNFEGSSDVLELASGLSTSEPETSSEDRELSEQVRKLTSGAAHLALGVSVVLDVFQAMPILNLSQLSELDRAIDVLRDKGRTASIERSEECRVYLAVLSFVRLTNHIRGLLEDKNSYRLSIYRHRLCTLAVDELKEHLRQIRVSLTYLEEGLVINPADPETSQRNARRKVQGFVTKFLTSDVVGRFEDLFDPATLDGQAAEKVARTLCRDVARPANPDVTTETRD